MQSVFYSIFRVLLVVCKYILIVIILYFLGLHIARQFLPVNFEAFFGKDGIESMWYLWQKMREMGTNVIWVLLIGSFIGTIKEFGITSLQSLQSRIKEIPIFWFCIGPIITGLLVLQNWFMSGVVSIHDVFTFMVGFFLSLLLFGLYQMFLGDKSEQRKFLRLFVGFFCCMVVLQSSRFISSAINDLIIIATYSMKNN